MTSDFEAVLDEALSRLGAGEAVEDCLTSYPEHARSLEPLLRTAAFSERALAGVEAISETASVAGKQRLLAAAAQQRLLAAVAVEQAPPASQRKPARPPVKLFRLFALPATRLAAAALTLLFLVVLGGGLAAAASLPGDLLYPIKLATEQVRLFITVDAQAREELLVKFGQERRAEAAAVLETGRKARLAFEGTLQRFGDSLWIVEGLPVSLDAHTFVEGDPGLGATVAVEGLAPGDGSLLASRLTIKSSGKMQQPIMTGVPTMAPLPGETNTTWPTRTHEPEPTYTTYPTETCEPTATTTLHPTHTSYPTETCTCEPRTTPTPSPTDTEEPAPTLSPQPTSTSETEPTHMVHPTKTPHH